MSIGLRSQAARDRIRGTAVERRRRRRSTRWRSARPRRRPSSSCRCGRRSGPRTGSCRRWRRSRAARARGRGARRGYRKPASSAMVRRVSLVCGAEREEAGDPVTLADEEVAGQRPDARDVPRRPARPDTRRRAPDRARTARPREARRRAGSTSASVRGERGQLRDQLGGRPADLDIARECLEQAGHERRAVVLAVAGLLDEVFDDRGGRRHSPLIAGTAD